MEVYREEIGASGDAVAAVVGHDGEDRWKCWGRVAGNLVGWCGLGVIGLVDGVGMVWPCVVGWPGGREE